MAVTRLNDVISNPVFLPYTIQRIAQKSMLRQSGIASPDLRIQQFANGPGSVVTMPFWNDLTGRANKSSDDPAQVAVPNKLTTGADSAIKIRMNNGWSSANLVSSLLAQQPLNAVAELISDYWVREEEATLVEIMNGVFASADMAGNVLDVASEDAATSGVNFDADVETNATALLGEYGMDLAAVLMHSRVFYNLKAKRAITYEKDPVTGLDFAVYDGKRALVSDACPRVAGATNGFKYTSYLFGAGAVGYAEATGAGGPEEPVEFDSVPGAGNGEGVKTVWHRRHVVMHPRGVKFALNLNDTSPTSAQLAAGTSWERVYDNRLVRLVAVVTNG